MLTTSTNHGPNFYLNDTLTISCTTSGFTDIDELRLHSMEYGSMESIGCLKNRWGFTPFVSLKLKRLGFSLYEQSGCKYIAANKASGYTISISASINAEMDGLRLECEAVDTIQKRPFRVVAPANAIINHLKGKYYITILLYCLSNYPVFVFQ